MNVQFHELGLLVELSVKITGSPTQTVVEFAENAATGAVVHTFTVMKLFCVSVSLPPASVTLNETA